MRSNVESNRNNIIHNMSDSRSLLIKKNVFFSFILKFVDGIIYLLVVPITLDFLDEYSYGIWLIINSILVWINTFDVGLGNGLRNLLSKSVAKKEFHNARIYISTTYFLLLLLSLVLVTIFALLTNFIDWYSLLNVSVEIINNLNSVIFYSFLFCIVTFVLKIISSIYLALQLPAVSSMFSVLGNLFSLLIIIILKKLFIKGSLLDLSLVYTGVPILVYTIATVITFKYIFTELRPSVKLINIKKYGRSLFSTSSTFFIIQVAGLVLLSMSNVMISRLLGPESVSVYSIANRYMSISHMVIGILLTPLWSAVTNAYILNELSWIKKTLYNIRRILFAFIFVQLILILVSPFAYKVWLSENVEIPISLTIFMGIYTYMISWSLAHSTILNGLGKLRQQLYIIIFQVCAFIPLSYIFTTRFGVVGMCLSMIISNLPATILNTIQVNKILNGRANGFWEA